MNKIVRLAEIESEEEVEQSVVQSDTPSDTEDTQPEEAKSEADDASAVEAANDGDATPEEEGGINPEHLRMTEALLFASSDPLDVKALTTSLPEGADVKAILKELQSIYEKRGVTLVCVGGKWQFRTAPDLAFLLRKEQPEQKRLSRAAIETLAIISYHQPVTRAEIEDIRGVAVSKGTVDALMEIGWVKIRGRKRTPGRPVTYGTTDAFLVQFGLESVRDLPGMDELKAAGFLEALPPSGFDVPNPTEELAEDEDPYDPNEPEELATGGPDPMGEG